MKVRIDRDRDIVRILLRDAPIEESDEMPNGVICDYDADGRVVGFEFLNASSLLGDLNALYHEHLAHTPSPESATQNQQYVPVEAVLL